MTASTTDHHSDASGRMDICVIIPVLGEQHLTDLVIKDLLDDGYRCTIYVVDNGGDYRPRGAEHVLRPRRNLHWAGGCNFGLSIVKDRNFAAYVLLNNDVRSSRGFLAGMRAAWTSTGASLVAPAYDSNWPQQRIAYTGPAGQYRPRNVDRLVPFVDGTCLFIPHSVLENVGILDERTWPRYGWGCDKDYALRVRQNGGEVRVTERAYLNHLGRMTAAKAQWYDEREAEEENNAGMCTKWGPGWRDTLYAGFDGLARDGVVQLRLLRSNRKTTQGDV
jgi:GT2 family glycosyltransferase